MAYNQARKSAGEPSSTSNRLEVLEDEDLVEMVNAGLLPFIVMDEHKARFWQKDFPGITIHDAPCSGKGASSPGGAQGEPQLLAMLNEQIRRCAARRRG